MKAIKNVLVIMPAAKEPLNFFQDRYREMEHVKEILNARGIGLVFKLLDDGAPELPEEYSCLVKHDQNLGLARTLHEAYYCAVNMRGLKRKPDAVVRLDAQEHNVRRIPDIIDQLRFSEAGAVFTPIIYCREGEPRTPMTAANATINRLVTALKPVDIKVIGEIYNQVFPLGYQAFTLETLAAILPKFEKMLDYFREENPDNPKKQHATWGMDLVSLVLAANAGPIDITFFGDYAEPWAANRLDSHVANQRARVAQMLKVLAAHATQLDLELTDPVANSATKN